MTRRLLRVAIATLCCIEVAHAGGRGSTPAGSIARGRYANLQLTFESNRGQESPSVDFVAHGRGYSVLVAPTQTELVLSRSPASTPSVLRMTLVGARPGAPAAAEQALPGTVNYLVGNDPSKWRTRMPTFGRVRYHDAYPGIDV